MCDALSCTCAESLHIPELGRSYCAHHVPLHCDHCRSLEVSLESVSKKMKVRVYRCFKCGHYSRKPL